MVRVVFCCDECGSEELENWAESGEWWVHCHECDHDHEDGTELRFETKE